MEKSKQTQPQTQTNYEVLSSSYRAGICKMVEEFLSKGYICVGGVSIGEDEDGDIMLTQAVVMPIGTVGPVAVHV